jgi:acyl-coenzyme A thioesterase PaaI-like protein
VVKPGRAFHFCEADVFCIDDNGNEELIARATTTMAVIQVTGDR